MSLVLTKADAWRKLFATTAKQAQVDAFARATELDPEQSAWELFRRQLRDSVDVAAVARILCGVERRSMGLPPCELTDLNLKDAKRLRDLAEEALARLDEERHAEAIDEVAEVLCAGPNHEYTPLHAQKLSVQIQYRRWAQVAIDTYHAYLCGRPSVQKESV